MGLLCGCRGEKKEPPWLSSMMVLSCAVAIEIRSPLGADKLCVKRYL
jgi:hypothetical protein